MRSIVVNKWGQAPVYVFVVGVVVLPLQLVFGFGRQVMESFGGGKRLVFIEVFNVLEVQEA